MRRITARAEQLAAAPFVLLVGLGGGAVRGVPRLLLGGTGEVDSRAALAVVLGAATVLWWTAALLLWWIAVRRRRWSVWRTATHLTLGLALADVLTTSLGMVAASIGTNGMFAEAAMRDPMAIALPNLVLTLIQLPMWFVGSVVAVALGRHLTGVEQGSAASRPTATEPGTVT